MDEITANRRGLLLTPLLAVIAICGVSPANHKLLDPSQPRWRPV